MWTVSISLKEGDEGRAGYGSIFATWDDPVFSYSEPNGNINDKEGFYSRAEKTLEEFINKMKLESGIVADFQETASKASIPAFMTRYTPVVKI